MSELVHKVSKKQRVHDDREGDGGRKIDSEAERIGVESGRKNGETEAAVKSKKSGLTGAASGGLFSRFSPQHTTATQVQLNLAEFQSFFSYNLCSYSVMFVFCHVCVLILELLVFHVL